MQRGVDVHAESAQDLRRGLGEVQTAEMQTRRTLGDQSLCHLGGEVDADGTDLGKYRKMHIPDDPGYYEKFYFTPGDLGYPLSHDLVRLLRQVQERGRQAALLEQAHQLLVDALDSVDRA